MPIDRARFVFISLVGLLIASVGASTHPTRIAAEEIPSGPLTLWYKQPVPAGRGGKMAWDQGMPIGNGRLGGMVFGQTSHERIQLNEDTLWGGGPVSYTHLDVYKRQGLY